MNNGNRIFFLFCFASLLPVAAVLAQQPRQHISINEHWKFFRYASSPDALAYDVRPVVDDRKDDVVADSRPTAAVAVASRQQVLKHWILPSGNDFITDPMKTHQRPAGNPGADFSFVQQRYDDSKWESVDLPHDWAIKGPFYREADAIVGGGMGRLPVQGVAWYRRQLDIPAADKGRQIYLDIDGAMSYTMVWLNGHLVGGWPYGYNSFRLDLTPYIRVGSTNQLAIRLDNPANSARWYPGAGIYRNVWLTKVNPVHVAQWGSSVTTRDISTAAATVDMAISVDNKAVTDKAIRVVSSLYTSDNIKVATLPVKEAFIKAGGTAKLTAAVKLDHPRLWGPAPGQRPHLYEAVTQVFADGKLVDEYKTTFGIRQVTFDPVKGLVVNGMQVRMQGVNQHHDLGALGAAFNVRAAERQLEILQALGCNAIRLAHNPPAPELLELTDKMGFLVIDEIFDSWETKKTPLDFHLIFPDWHEPDTRAFIRRDKNHPSVIAWSFGNEVGEQYTEEKGAAVAAALYKIVKEEDSTRPATASMNYAKPDMPFPTVMDILSLNYQGEGIRDAPAYQGLKGIRTTPLYPAFQQKFPTRLIFSSETASALSTRETYLFPVTAESSAPVNEGAGGNGKLAQVSAYELYTAAFGASPDKVFASQDKHPYVAGEFVWSGFDYLGEPTPYYSARSSYSGIIDLAGLPKDRFYLYQSRWRPELPIAHLLPHWTWPGREGQVTPVHLFTSGDEAELFVNGVSMGRKKKAAFEYRLRWDSVVYQPGELRVQAYKNGKPWAADTLRTAGVPATLQLQADRKRIYADGKDLSFITVSVTDERGIPVPQADNLLHIVVSGAGTFEAADNGDPADLTSFAADQRKLFSGKLVLIVRSRKLIKGSVTVTVTGEGLTSGKMILESK
ncbi:beta-galactosidase GalB [Chitinophaga sp. Cy-1792]|uniref:beta-galactosidase GalB n=1 Tax=Chitinophaga sp. Cy-1792 TaxID=2608339 RepID=UPI001F03A668|nr:beta-galactosidase GalB [Chitinophaga sp. Cy-1792]